MAWEAGRTRNNELYEVWFDGLREPLAIKADVELGTIDRYRTNADGEILRNVLTDRPLTQRLIGHVELRRCNTPG